MPVPAKAALHLLHRIALTGKANLGSFVASAPAPLFNKLGRLMGDTRCPAAVRVAAAALWRALQRRRALLCVH
jgi:hypothetical protein